MNERHPESYCQRCNGPNVSWTAPSPLWNTVMRVDGRDEWPVVCPTCFMVLAKERGVADHFRLFAPDPLVRLPNVFTDGRVWNGKTWMWEQPAMVCKIMRRNGLKRHDPLPT